jgi:hypothetical protein
VVLMVLSDLLIVERRCCMNPINGLAVVTELPANPQQSYKRTDGSGLRAAALFVRYSTPTATIF